MKSAAILNSRQSLRPRGEEPWIQNTEMAVLDAVGKGYIILASVGMNAWEIPLYFASQHKARINLVAPVKEEVRLDEVRQNYFDSFHLDAKRAEFTPIFIPRGRQFKENFMQARDEKVLETADVIYPVSIRSGGNLEGLIEKMARQGAVLITGFQVKYELASSECKIDIDPARISSRLDSLLENYLIHWTRSVSSPWPGETAFQYYNDVVSAEGRYPRSAMATLARIMEQRKIVASGRHMRKGVSAVSFTGARPSESIKLMRWRARYREMTFEPYGVAIEKEVAADCGVRKVYYGEPEMYDYLDEKDKQYFQGLGKEGYWLSENEYRHIGDIDLRKVPSEKSTIIVWKREEAEEIARLFQGEIVSVYD